MKKTWRQTITRTIIAVGLVAACITILGFVTGKFSLAQFASTPSSSTSATQPASRQGHVHATPTIPPKMYSLNLVFRPLYPNPSGNIAAVLNTITVDASTKESSWSFTITNGVSYSLSDMTFNVLELDNLDNPNSQPYPATGQAHDTWDLGSGALAVETPIFGFVPQSGVHYRLKLTITATNWTQTYQDQVFVFHPDTDTVTVST